MAPRKRDPKSVYQPVAGSDNLELNTENGVFYVRKYRAGKGELFKSTRSKKKGEAKTIADDMIADWLGLKVNTRRRARIEPLAAAFLAECKSLHETLDKDGHPLRRKSTYKHDMSHCKLIKELFGECYADEIDELFWNNWIKTKGHKLNRTLGDIAKYLRLILGYAYRHKQLGRIPLIKNPDKETNSAVVYEDAQIELFLKHARPDWLQEMIFINGENPLRPFETRELRWEFISFEKDGGVILRLPTWFTKTKKYRELEVSPNAAEIFRRRKAASDGSPYVFPSPTSPDRPLSDAIVSRSWRETLARAGFKGRYLFHWLRHSTYTKLLMDANLPIQHVSEAGGTSIRVLQQRYLKSSHARTRIVGQAIRLKLVDKPKDEDGDKSDS